MDCAIRPFWRAFWPMALACAFILPGCAQLPPQVERTASVALQETGDTHLGRAVAPLSGAHPGKSGVVALPQGIDAFAARARLADVAERSLDVQYYIWHDDMSGRLLFDSLRRAADRGVRVRLLLDDNSTAGMDELLAELSVHRNIEVRLFNPFASRGWRALGYLTDFGRLNRRMHNKSFTADNQVTIVGGRNVGDEYFGAGNDVQFIDLDVMAIGDVVHQVSDDFDRYWASDSAYPAERVLSQARRSAATPGPAADDQLAALSTAYLEAIRRQPLVREMVEQRLNIEWADVRLVSDDPSKGEGEARDDQLLWTRLKRILPPPKHELELVSPYFVPGAAGVEHFVEMAKGGAKITILTNSLEATDVAAVHAGYAKRRQPLLEAGISLFEMKRGSSAPRPAFMRPAGSSASSLHAKTFVVDRTTVFVGSFNFDPRSAGLNTELGFIIECPAMAATISDAVTGPLAQRAYRVRLGAEGALQWIEQVGLGEVVHEDEPGVGFWRKFGVSVLSWLPIEWLL
jgi:putative cardiolipin synthase